MRAAREVKTEGGGAGIPGPYENYRGRTRMKGTLEEQDKDGKRSREVL